LNKCKESSQYSKVIRQGVFVTEQRPGPLEMGEGKVRTEQEVREMNDVLPGVEK